MVALPAVLLSLKVKPPLSSVEISVALPAVAVLPKVTIAVVDVLVIWEPPAVL